MSPSPRQAPLRGTQLLVEHIGSVLRRPGLIAIEVGWRWLFGVRFLIACRNAAQQIVARYPLESSGFNLVNGQDPWGSAAQFGRVVGFYLPHIAVAAQSLLPLAALAWIALSGLGRAWILHFLLRDGAKKLPLRLPAMLLLQALWLAALSATCWAWFASMRSAWVRHVPPSGDPDLVGYSMWAIFLTLGFFTVWALVSWTLSVAPLLVLLEKRSVLSALGASLQLGREYTSKLAEINLVLGIVKLALMVVAMVLSAAPLPFSDQLGPQALHTVWAGAVGFFLLADDAFQVVRLKAFAVFWKAYRG